MLRQQKASDFIMQHRPTWGCLRTKQDQGIVAGIAREIAMLRQTIVILLAILLGACGGGGGGTSSGGVVNNPPEPPAAAADINVLMLGNSHSVFNNLPAMLANMVRSTRPGQTVSVQAAAEYLFLEDRLRHQPTLQLFNSRRWQYVILQAQQYSASGTVIYSTTAAEQFIRMTRAQGGQAVMFPEWPRIGVDETMLVYNIHKDIALREGACLAPVGQAWDLSNERRGGFRLHADDGNHSNPNGAFLAALVLYATMTGQSPLNLPYLNQYTVTEGDQAFLRQVAADIVAQIPTRQYCQ
jgi:hypothetical protein